MISNIDIQLQRAVALHGQGEPAQAALLYAEILKIRPDHPDALHLLGVTETQLGDAQAGLARIVQSLAINPNQPGAITNLGNALLALHRPTEALAKYDEALRLWPDYPLAAFGRGNALAALRRPLEALSSFDRSLELASDFVEALLGRGAALLKLERPADALASYARAIELAPTSAHAHLGNGSALLALRAYDEAKASIDRALKLTPDFAEAFVERGHLLSELGQTDAAIDAYGRAAQLNPKLAAAWFSHGLALSLQARYVEAAVSLRRVIEIDPEHPYARGAHRHALLQFCDWSGYPTGIREIAASVSRGQPADFPFSFLAVCDSPSLQLQCARRFTELHLSGRRPLWTGKRESHERIRVAYISGDFLEHPTSYLMAGVFERHDRHRFETIGVSLRDDARSPTARRVEAAFERFVVAGARSDRELAQLIHDMGIDIAVDLMGYTGEHRAGIFTYRPAPIQVNYLGFPASMGSPHMDYIIADKFLIPESHRSDYSEFIVYLPECFQANDDRKPTAPEAPTRADVGLPNTGFVWCSFHSSHKINPILFDIWARLLLAVPGSVLWLVGGKPAAEHNLRREALARGVDAERLVFAQPLPYPRHIVRLPLADLCLDTWPFNGGATTSDALWAAVPVVTCAGSSFAARMSGSLLHALGIPELVTQSLSEYERLALQLAQNAGRLAQLRAAIARNRRVAPMFDTDRFRRHLEAAFLTMIERHRQDLPPATFSVPLAAP